MLSYTTILELDRHLNSALLWGFGLDDRTDTESIRLWDAAHTIARSRGWRVPARDASISDLIVFVIQCYEDESLMHGLHRETGIGLYEPLTDKRAKTAPLFAAMHRKANAG